MSFTYNGTEVQGVTYNGTEVQKVTYNGVTVWEYAVPFDHNTYGGNDITTYFTSGQLSTDIARGDFRNVKVGDYIDFETDRNAPINDSVYRWRAIVLHADYFKGKSGNSTNMSHHLVVALKPTGSWNYGLNISTGVPNAQFHTAYYDNNNRYGSYRQSLLCDNIENKLYNKFINITPNLEQHVLPHKVCMYAETGKIINDSTKLCALNVCQIGGNQNFDTSEDMGDEIEQFDYFRQGKYVDWFDGNFWWTRTKKSSGDVVYVVDNGTNNVRAQDAYWGEYAYGMTVPYFLLY